MYDKYRFLKKNTAKCVWGLMGDFFLILANSCIARVHSENPQEFMNALITFLS